MPDIREHEQRLRWLATLLSEKQELPFPSRTECDVVWRSKESFVRDVSQLRDGLVNQYTALVDELTRRELLLPTAVPREPSIEIGFENHLDPDTTLPLRPEWVGQPRRIPEIP